jgi:hypothetical protein
MALAHMFASSSILIRALSAAISRLWHFMVRQFLSLIIDPQTQ